MNKDAYIIIFLISVLISAISQLLLKKSANRQHKSKIKEYLNPFVLAAYFMFFGSTLLTVFAYKGVPLTLGPILESTGYIFVAVLSTVFLKEKMTQRKIAGNILIVLGVIVATYV
jgi:small multidrug resistance pump